MNTELPPKLEQIINKALEKDRELRYQSASDMRAHLRTVGPGLALAKPIQEPALNAVKGPALRRWAVTVSILTLLLVAGFLWFTKRPRPSPPGLPELKQRQLTTNSGENEVMDGEISPDGKYLVYEDRKGIHIKLLETGEVQAVSEPEAFRESQVPNGSWGFVWFPDSTTFLLTASIPARHPSIWTVSVMGGAPQKLRDDAFAWSVSPDGSSVAFTTNPGKIGDREVWLMAPNGGQARKLYETDQDGAFASVKWSPDGQRLAYLNTQAGAKRQAVIETRDLKRGSPIRIRSAPLESQPR